MNNESLWGKEFGTNLQRMLHRKGVTQGYLAKELNTTDTMISRYVNGAIIPSVYKVCQIANIIGCDISDLVKTEYNN